MLYEDETDAALKNAEALKYAKTALRINATLLPALSMACQASARLGNDKDAQEYLKQFGRAGGDRKALKETMDFEIRFAMEDDMEKDAPDDDQ